MGQDRHQEKDYEHKEQEFRNACRREGDPREAKHCRDQRNQQECKCPTEHDSHLRDECLHVEGQELQYVVPGCGGVVVLAHVVSIRRS